MQLLNHVFLARQRTHQPEQQMNFHLGKSMNCPMRLGLSETTCPQRLREQNPVKVVFVLYDSEPSRSCNCLCPLFLLVLQAIYVTIHVRTPSIYSSSLYSTTVLFKYNLVVARNVFSV
jgi:hypothetical protein